MRRPHVILVSAAAALVAGAVPYLLGSPALAAAPRLTATIVQVSTWSTGYGADVSITNSGDAPASSWVVEFDLPAGTTVSS